MTCERCKKLEAAIQTVLDGGVPRVVMIPYRTAPNKNDMCPHRRYMWDDCGQCTDEYLRGALDNR